MPFSTSQRRGLAVERLEARLTPADILTVTNLGDTGTGTLRDAIAQANADPDSDTIRFAAALAGKPADLSSVGDGGIGPSALLITTPITINGSGQTINRIGSTLFRLFAISPTGNLTLRNLTLSQGVAQGGAGGNGGGGAAGLGGAIYNQGVLRIFGCTIVGNHAVGGANSGGGDGGGGGLGGPGTRFDGSPNAGNGGPPNAGRREQSNARDAGFGGGGSFGVGNTFSWAGGGNGGFGGGGGQGDSQLNSGGGYHGATGGAGGFGGGGGGGNTDTVLGHGGAPGVGGFGGGNGAFGSGGGGTGDGGGGAGMGGAIFNQGGTVTIGNSTITGNTAQGGRATSAEAGSAYGAGLFNLNGAVTLTNVTIAGNTLVAGVGTGDGSLQGEAAGGGIYNLSLNVGNVTATQNATMVLANNLFANNLPGPDVVNNRQSGSATMNATGPNLASTPVSNNGFLAGTAFLVRNPGLAALANNGGPTRTMALLPGSPAIDAGDEDRVTTGALGGGPPFYDQRGANFNRISERTVDLGAFEFRSPRLIVSADRGGPPTVKVYSPTGTLLGRFEAYGAAFAGGVRTAVADVNGDDVQDIFCAPGPGGAPYVNIFDGRTFARLRSILVYGETFTLGVNLTTGDVLGDGALELLTSPDVGGSPFVNVFNPITGARLKQIQVYGDAFRQGVRLATGQVAGDGKKEILVAPGPGGAPVVNVFLAASGTRIRQIEVYPMTFTAGLYIACGDLTGDGDQLIVGPGAGGAPVVKVFDVDTLQNVRSWQAFASNYTYGLCVGVVDLDRDGKADIIAAVGEGGAPYVRGYEYDGRTSPNVFLAFADTMRAGLFVTGAD